MRSEKKPLIVDIFIPYCVTQLSYCSHMQAMGLNEEKNAYMAALKRELLSYEQDLDGYEIRAVRLSGGNATVMKPDLLGNLLRTLRSHLPLSSGAEVSVDANPLTIGTPSLTGLSSGKPNRIDLVAHSMQDEELQALHAPYGAQQIRNAMLFLHRFRVNNISFSIDLGIPSQSDVSWHNTLHAAVIMHPGHIRIRRCQAPGLSDLLSRYRHACEYLKENGYSQYSAGNFCLPHHAHQFLLERQKGAECIGIGVGQSTILDGYLTRNTNNLQLYIQNAGNFQKTTAQVSAVDELWLQENYVRQQLRSADGLSEAGFEETFHTSLPASIAEKLDTELEKGTLQKAEGSFLPTETGLFQRLELS